MVLAIFVTHDIRMHIKSCTAKCKCYSDIVRNVVTVLQK